MVRRLWKSEIYSHLLVTFVYFFLVSILRLGELGRLGILGVLGMLGGMWAGGILGTFFLDIDHLVYWFVTNTEKEDSVKAKEIWERRGMRGLGEMRELLEKYHHTHNRLMFHSAVAQVVLLLLAFYLLISGGNIFGSALIMSINLHLLKDVWTDFVERKEYLKDYLFWQVREPKIKEHVREYLIGASLIFLILTRFLI